MEQPQVTSGPTTVSAGKVVLRNTLYLGIAEVLSMPISVLLNGMLGRYLGPEDMGHIYLAGTISGLAFLVINWGGGGALPAAVVREQSASGQLLGTSLAWRTGASLVGYAIVAGACHLFGFSAWQQWAIGLVFLTHALNALTAACQEVIRGFERTDVAAYSRVGSQLIAVALVIPTLLLGGQMRMALLVQALAVVFVLVPVLRVLRPIGIGKLEWDQERFKSLMAAGTPFAFFGLGLVLQPNIDAFYLTKLTSAEVVGWYAVTQKLVGFLLMPATALIGALYPTLCRLYTSDMESFRRTTRDSISTICLLVVPVVLGCALYADIGISIFGRDAFREAEDTLRLASIFLFLVYFTLPIGTAIIATGKQRTWTLIQLFCVLNSAVLDPFLIPYFQSKYGNGSLGLCVASATSEAVMVSAGIMLLPSGTFDRSLLRVLSLALLSGGAMAGSAYLLRPLPSLAAAPIAVSAYAVAAYFTGAVSKEQVGALTGFLRRKLARRRASS